MPIDSCTFSELTHGTATIRYTSLYMSAPYFDKVKLLSMSSCFAIINCTARSMCPFYIWQVYVPLWRHNSSEHVGHIIKLHWWMKRIILIYFIAVLFLEYFQLQICQKTPELSRCKYIVQSPTISSIAPYKLTFEWISTDEWCMCGCRNVHRWCQKANAIAPFLWWIAAELQLLFYVTITFSNLSCNSIFVSYVGKFRLLSISTNAIVKFGTSWMSKCRYTDDVIIVFGIN